MFSETFDKRPFGIIFDAVGTLIDPAPPVAEAYAAAAARQGVVLDRGVVKERFHRFFRNDEMDEPRGPLQTDEPSERRRWQRIVGNVLPEVPDPVRAFGELWDHFGRSAAWRCFPDVGPVLETLRRRGIPVRVASNFDARLRSVVAGLDELRGLADCLVISSEVAYRKPHPAFFQAVCASIGLPPDRLLSVGDDERNDVLGAEAAGLRGLWLDRSGRKAGALPRITALEELEAHLPG